MKKAIVRSVLFLICASLAGCASQKKAHNSVDQERHREAMTAMSDGCFVIEVDEFFASKAVRNPAKALSRSYVSICDGHAEFQFAPDRTMRLRSLADRLNRGNSATIVLVKRKKNGDALFEAVVRDASGWSGCSLSVTLYANTNECSAIVHGAGRQKENLGSFRGRVFPLSSAPAAEAR